MWRRIEYVLYVQNEAKEIRLRVNVLEVEFQARLNEWDDFRTDGLVMLSIRNYSIKMRLWVMLIVSTGCILAILLGTLYKTFESVFDARHSMIRQQVGTAYSLVEHYYALEQQGMSRAQAQAEAKSAIKALRYEHSEYFWINNSEPKMIMHPIDPSLEGIPLNEYKDAAGLLLFKRMTEVAHAHPEGGFVPYMWPKASGGDPISKSSYVRLFTPWDWIVGTGVYVDDVQAEFVEKAIQLSAISAFLILVMVVLNIAVVRSIRLPVSAFTSAMHNIAQGEGDLTQRLPNRGKDELAAIAHSFNSFTTQIHRVVTETKASVEVLAGLSREVTDSSQQTSNLANQQLQQTDLAATASNEMSLTIQEVAGNAERAAVAARDVEESAKRGFEIMQQTQKSIMQLASATASTSDEIQTLRNETDAIGSVLEVIRGIAEQTNLLALNAAIEAARAGEQGRGFAVVADEVRTLAMRSHQATEEIDRMILTLQEQASRAVASMQENAQTSEKTAAAADTAMDAMADISGAIGTISEMNMGIASAVEEQSVAANEISGNVVNIADSSNNIARFMDDATDATQRLEAQAQQLVALVERFKV